MAHGFRVLLVIFIAFFSIIIVIYKQPSRPLRIGSAPIGFRSRLNLQRLRISALPAKRIMVGNFLNGK
jgi:hypothetical protein